MTKFKETNNEHFCAYKCKNLFIIKCYPEFRISYVYFSLENFPRFVKALKDRAE